jgi:hypothetical protein
VKTGAALEGQGQGQQQEVGGGDTGAVAGQGLPQRDVMDDLVDRLAALEDSQ